jgi:hypothetical protein
MAKTKSDKKTTKKVVDEEEPISQPTDAEVDFDVSASEVETDVGEADADAEADADVEGDVDADTDAADADAGTEGAGGDEEDKAPVDETPVPPKAKTTWLTVILIVLNWVAVPAFGFLFYLDYAVRLQYSYRTLINYTQIWGLPLAAETEHPSVSNETRPTMRLTARQLEESFKKRPGVNTSMGKELQPVEEPVPIYLTVGDMTDELLLDIYGKEVPADERYPTLEAAIDGLRKKLPDTIADAAKQVKDAFLGKNKKEEEKRAFVLKSIFIMTWDSAEVKKMEDAVNNAKPDELDDMVKRAVVQKILFPIALDYSDLKDDPTVKKDGVALQRREWLVERIADDLAKAKGKDLDALVDEAVQRRIYHDILAPINLFRPGDLNAKDVERIADRDKVKMDKVKELLENRLKAAVASKYDLTYHMGAEAWGTPQERDSVEKRQKIAFILFTLAHVQIPLLDKKLYAKGIERAQTVSGLYEFTNASIAFVQAQRILEQRRESRIVESRDGNTFPASEKGILVKDDKGNAIPMRTEGIIDQQPAQIDRLQRIVEHIDAGQKRLDELIVQRDHLRKLYEQRVAQHKAIADKLIKARQGTEKYAIELRNLQNQLHATLLELSDAADTNFRLEAEIRALELSYFKTPPQKGGKK